MKVCIIGSYAKALVMTADRIPVAGETLMGRDYRGEFGGKGSDMAVQSSRLGAEVSYIGVIGDDTFGKEFVDLMKDEKIDISGLRITKEKSTGTGFIIKDIDNSYILSLFTSILMIICGVVLIINPGNTALVITTLIGIILIVYSVSAIVDMFVFKSRVKEIDKYFSKLLK